MCKIWSTIKRIASANENVWKYVFEKDSAVAEAVLYRYPSFSERTVICCSTQSGCPVGCRFCFMPGTNIKVIRSNQTISIPIESVEDGDEVIGPTRIQRVEAVMTRQYDGDIIEIELENGELLSVTEDHELLDKWGNSIIAKDLTVNDEL